MTKDVGARIRRCATKLLDEKLFKKVSSGDLIASEAKYHAKCLVALYNAAARFKYRKKGRKNQLRSIMHEHLLSFLQLLRRHLLIQRNTLRCLNSLILFSFIRTDLFNLK